LQGSHTGDFAFKITEDNIRSSIENYTPSNSRSQLIEKESNKIILDAYNANPSSMKLAIENLAKLNADKKVLLLGAMAELGEESLNEHKAIVDVIKKYNWEKAVLVGGDFLKFDNPFVSLNSSAEAREWLKNQQLNNTYILVKGSRSMQMEKVFDN